MGEKAIFGKSNLKRYYMNQFETLKNLLMSMEKDFEKFYDKNNSAAGTRVRKGLQDLKNQCQEIRLDVQNRKNAG